MKRDKLNIIYIAVGTPFGSDISLKCLLDSDVGKKYINPLIVTPNKNDIYNNGQQVKLPIMSETYSKETCNSLLKFLIGNFIKRPIKRVISFILLQKTIMSFKPDIIHTNVGVYSIGYKLARLNCIPHIWHIREFQTLDLQVKIIGGLKKRKKIFNNKYNIPIAITKSIYDFFELSRNKRSLVIYNGIKSKDDIIFNPKKEDYFIYVGQIKESKGIADIIEAFILFNKDTGSRTKLFIIGNEKQNPIYTRILKNKILESGLEQQIIFKGMLSTREVDYYMQKSRAIIVASYFEALGRVTIEAMFNGCLVIGRNTAGTKEQFDNGKELVGSEIALRFKDISELSRLLKDVDNNLNTYFDMIKLSQKVVVNTYSIEGYSKKIIDLYKKTKYYNDFNSTCIL